MGDMSGADGNHEVALDVQDNELTQSSKNMGSSSCASVPFLQKIFAEALATYFLVFAGCASVLSNLDNNNVITLLGIAVVWGLAVMVMIYSVGHISGAHMNPAVTIAFATSNRFPWKQVPVYVSSQLLGAIVASGTVRLIFNGEQHQYSLSAPAGSNLQSFVMEFIVTFFLMFVICGVATDNRAIGELAGLAVGATITLNVIIAAPISGASMNPARSLGPAVVSNEYKGVWIYVVAPIAGAVVGGWVYNLIRFTDKPLREITKSGSFLKSMRLNSSSNSI